MVVVINLPLKVRRSGAHNLVTCFIYDIRYKQFESGRSVSLQLVQQLGIRSGGYRSDDSGWVFKHVRLQKLDTCGVMLCNFVD